MLDTAGALGPRALGAGWYRDPVDRDAARFHDGKRWTRDAQPGAGRMLGTRPSPTRPRAELTRHELQRRHALTRWSFLGQYYDIYL